MYEYTELDQIDTTLPVMFDLETDDLYGPVVLASFYQSGMDEAILLKRPDPLLLMLDIKDMHLVMHNAAYDMSTLQNQSGTDIVFEKISDTFYLSRLKFYSGDKFNLPACLDYAGIATEFDKEAKARLQKSDWTGRLTEEQIRYAKNDTEVLQELYDVVKPYEDDVSYKLDISALKIMLKFQRNGMPVDPKAVDEKFMLNQKLIDTLQAKVGINVNSPPQVREYLNRSGTCDDLTLALLNTEKSIDVRKLRKLLKMQTFLRKLDGDRTYGYFSPSARSGRATCKKDNLQQLPRSIKDVFGVEHTGDKVLVYTDFSQLELRCITAVVRDPLMLDTFTNNGDLHTLVAEKIYGRPAEQITIEERRIAKCCNFSLLYGAGAYTFAGILIKDTGINLSDNDYAAARTIVKNWKRIFSTTAAWQRRGATAYDNRTAWKTPMGRRYVGRMITDQLNICIQGFGADVAKLANVLMQQKLHDKYGAITSKWQCNFIHDSYIFVIPKDADTVDFVSRTLAKCMQEAWFSVCNDYLKENEILPMPVTVSIDYNWDAAEKNPMLEYTFESDYSTGKSVTKLTHIKGELK